MNPEQRKEAPVERIEAAPEIRPGVYRVRSLWYDHSVLYLGAGEWLHLKRIAAKSFWTRKAPRRFDPTQCERLLDAEEVAFIRSLQFKHGEPIGPYILGQVDCHRVLAALLAAVPKKGGSQP